MKRWKLFTALFLFLVLTQVFIFGISRENWFDVSFSLQMAHKINAGDKIDWSHTDVHPPVYYYVVAGWERLNPGISEFIWLQELSVLFGLGFVISVFLLLSHWFGASGENAAMALSIMTPYLHFGTEGRMYMLLLMISAMVLWLRSTKQAPWLVYGCLFLVPFIHYFGVMIIVMIVAYDFLLEKRFDIWVWLCGAAGAILSFILFAYPQQHQSAGTWYFVSTITSFPSAMIYTTMLIDDIGNQGRSVSLLLYVGFIAFLLLAMYLIFRAAKVKDQKNKFVIFMMLSIMAPLILLSLQTVFPNIWRLYHHRIFLPVTWLFSVALFVAVFSWIDLHKWKKIMLPIFSVLVIIFALGVIEAYNANAHHELENMILATPCTGNLTYVLHESPFSSMPYESYNRDHKCGWVNQVTTDLDLAMSHTAGFDAIDRQNIFWNGTYPNYSEYYFVLGIGHIENQTIGMNWTEVATNPGIIVIKVTNN